MKNILEEVEKAIKDTIETDNGHYIEAEIMDQPIVILVARPDNFEMEPEQDEDGFTQKH